MSLHDWRDATSAPDGRLPGNAIPADAVLRVGSVANDVVLGLFLAALTSSIVIATSRASDELAMLFGAGVPAARAERPPDGGIPPEPAVGLVVGYRPPWRGRLLPRDPSRSGPSHGRDIKEARP